MPCADGEGYLYSSQVNFAAAGMHEGHLPDSDPKTRGWTFENSVFAKNCLIAATHKGMQTDASLADRYKLLVVELRAREVRAYLLIACYSVTTGSVHSVCLCARVRVRASVSEVCACRWVCRKMTRWNFRLW